MEKRRGGKRREEKGGTEGEESERMGEGGGLSPALVLITGQPCYHY